MVKRKLMIHKSENASQSIACSHMFEGQIDENQYTTSFEEWLTNHSPYLFKHLNYYSVASCAF